MEDYIDVKDLGLVKQDRLKRGIQLSCVHYDEKDDLYMLTKKALTDFDNFFLWLSGTNNYLKARTVQSEVEMDIWNED